MDHRYLPKIKICGITSVNDAVFAASSGADAIGLVFYEPSPRSVTIAQAIDIAYAVGPLVTVVGLFVDAQASYVNDVLSQVPLHVLQFHGNEDQHYCEQFNRPYMKALRMKEGVDVNTAIDGHPRAAGILLDTYKKGIPGGTGETFNWAKVPASVSKPLVLAGGLTPENVAAGIRQARPYGVDVSGGVEASAGIKDHAKVFAFINHATVGV